MNRDMFLTARPVLCGLLKKQGHKAERIPNPWQEGKSAWLFPFSLELCRDVCEYYAGIGKPAPTIIVDKIAELSQEVEGGRA